LLEESLVVLFTPHSSWRSVWGVGSTVLRRPLIASKTDRGVDEEDDVEGKPVILVLEMKDCPSK
jgi:hypothetical protein